MLYQPQLNIILQLLQMYEIDAHFMPIKMEIQHSHKKEKN